MIFAFMSDFMIFAILRKSGKYERTSSPNGEKDYASEFSLATIKQIWRMDLWE